MSIFYVRHYVDIVLLSTRGTWKSGQACTSWYKQVPLWSLLTTALTSTENGSLVVPVAYVLVDRWSIVSTVAYQYTSSPSASEASIFQDSATHSPVGCQRLPPTGTHEILPTDQGPFWSAFLARSTFITL
jgi:hypothetical protein